ncbi:hypothetical protein [Zobellia nedashkovskayae]|uniref:hypothetical protein n=1 Tax=Zobellia nedashkovskayae TaxID=2779510 RepID=UPI00188CF7F0|nr:hypothetical protein [Zobellia nedashkovskayae]
MHFTVKKTFLISIILCCYYSYGQVKIGENSEVMDPTSLLELESTDKVLVITRVSDSDMQTLTPLNGALVYNTDENCVFYYSGTQWNNLCNSNGGDETLSTLIDNQDGTFTYTNEAGNETLISLAGNETLSTLVDNEDGTFTYTNEAGDETVFSLPENEGGTNDETLSTLIDNENGTFTYTNEAGEETIISFGGSGDTGDETLSTLVDNENGTFTYTNEGGEETIISFETSGTGEETVTNLIRNDNGTYTYTNENDEETLIFFDHIVDQDGNVLFVGDPGSLFFADEFGEPKDDVSNLYYSEENQQLGIGTNEPSSTLTVNGSIATDIRFIGGDGIVLTDKNHTVIITTNSTIFLPDAPTCAGRMYIIKKKSSISVSIANGYSNTDSNPTSTIPTEENVIWLQSNGFIWEQVN